LFGVLTSVLDLAPVLGPALMAIPAFIFGLSQSMSVAVLAAAYFIVLTAVEAHVLAPLVTGRAVRISPSLIIVAVPVGLSLFGPVGGFIAIPITAALQVIAREVVLPWWRGRIDRKERGEA
jgi:predicted PurR-regulated permease PerM